MSDVTITLEEQLAHFDRVWERAYYQIIAADKRRKLVIKNRARKKLIQGFDEFGDVGFHKSSEELEFEEIDEVADELDYRVMRLWGT